jgi:hypothetical protein
MWHSLAGWARSLSLLRILDPSDPGHSYSRTQAPLRFSRYNKLIEASVYCSRLARLSIVARLSGFASSSARVSSTGHE